MKDGPNIALLGALIGDPARANMLTALMSGKALTASELAQEASITLQTASAHLGKMRDGGLIRLRKQGRHRYFSLAGEEVGHVLESLMGLAALRGHTRIRTGPKEPALRKSRVCYNHLAGDLGVALFDGLVARKLLLVDGENIELSDAGRAYITNFGVDLAALDKKRRPLCKPCLDWSNRRSHLAGSLGVELLTRFYELGWAKREANSRVVSFSKTGERKLQASFGT